MQYILSLQASAFNSPTGCQPASQGHKDGNLTCYVRFDLLQPGFVFSDGEPTSVREFLVAPVPMVDNRRLPDLLGLQAQTCISVVTKEQNMATTIDVASKAVATACAHVSNLVTIVSFNPLSTRPDNLFVLSLAKIGVSDTGTFLESLTEQFPQFAQDLQQMALTADTQLGLIVNLLESLLDQV